MEEIDFKNMSNEELLDLASLVKLYPVSNERFHLSRQANIECFRRGI